MIRDSFDESSKNADLYFFPTEFVLTCDSIIMPLSQVMAMYREFSITAESRCYYLALAVRNAG